MSENFTRTHNLVEEITSKGWFADPSGRHGYEVILLERVGDGGTRYYCSLKPGERLRVSERVFGKYIALIVDVRHARAFPIDKEIPTRERGRSVRVRANVRYHVINARVVAMETLDPLGELRDKVIATLNRELSNYSESEIFPHVVEQIIRSVGNVAHLGLSVEDAEILEFSSDRRITDQVVEEEDLEHQIRMTDIGQQADLDAQSRENTAKIQLAKEKHDAVRLTDINVLMHEHPDLVPQIFGAFAEKDRRLLDARFSLVQPALEAYINQRQQDDEYVEPDEIIRILQTAVDPSSSRSERHLLTNQITWGEDIVEAESPRKPQQTPKKSVLKKESSEDESDDASHIKFG